MCIDCKPAALAHIEQTIKDSLGIGPMERQRRATRELMISLLSFRAGALGGVLGSTIMAGIDYLRENEPEVFNPLIDELIQANTERESVMQ